MPKVTKMHTIKENDGTGTEVYYGVKSAKYIEVVEGKTLETELAEIKSNINNLNNRISDLESLQIVNNIERLEGLISGLDDRIKSLENTNSVTP